MLRRTATSSHALVLLLLLALLAAATTGAAAAGAGSDTGEGAGAAPSLSMARAKFRGVFVEQEGTSPGEEELRTYCFTGWGVDGQGVETKTVVFVYNNEVMLRFFADAIGTKWFENPGDMNTHSHYKTALPARPLESFFDDCQAIISRQPDAVVEYDSPTPQQEGKFFCGVGTPATPDFEGIQVVSIRIAPLHCDIDPRSLFKDYKPLVEEDFSDETGPSLVIE
eukprot:TRINITY_DN6938_c0_g1_i1.p1 TRINITY_DN6938_c0_g1~~TRINITY_DN6938_c0_g1_i1.p1  ORF type:complete len:224 (-),score=60.52 TRINITY_DN6938_c0_g1_i1:244-915(-)